MLEFHEFESSRIPWVPRVPRVPRVPAVRRSATIKGFVTTGNREFWIPFNPKKEKKKSKKESRLSFLREAYAVERHPDRIRKVVERLSEGLAQS